MSKITMQEEAVTPSTPTSGKWSLYPKPSGFYVLDDAGNEAFVGVPAPGADGDVLTVVSGSWTSSAPTGGGGGGGGFNEGFMTNGKIVPSVASNNLTLALKTLAGTDPSSTDKVQIRIGDVIHEITSALSVTKNAATNWCNAGSAELATQEVNYFAYIGYNATDGITIGFSRIPYAAIYSDFSTTTTNEKYCAISTITNAAAGDNYVNVGRFSATLSAGAGYTWTVPTFTNKNLIQYPIYTSDWLVWVPTISVGYSSPPTNAVYRYKIIDRECWFTVREATSGTSNTTADAVYSLPFTALTLSNAAWYGTHQYLNNGTADVIGGCIISSGGSTVTFFRNLGAAWTASGSRRIIALTQGMFFPIG